MDRAPTFIFNHVKQNKDVSLTVNDRKDEKRVPSSYLDSLDSTPSKIVTN